MHKSAYPFSFKSLVRRVLGLAGGPWLRAGSALVAFCSVAFAQASEEEFDRFVFGGGPGDVTSHNQVSVFFGEVRFKANFKGVHPYALAGWADDSSSYFGVGIFYPIELSENWTLTIASGPGYYHRNDSPRDLGANIEFFSTAEISRRVWRDHRIGLSIGHISNAGLGHDINPGSETLSLSYSIPLRGSRVR